MKSLKVFLIDKTNSHAEFLKKKLLNLESIKFIVTIAGIKNAESAFRDNVDPSDVVMLSEKVPPSAIIQITKSIRSQNMVIPIFMLTKQSEARVSRRYLVAGVDDVLNIAEFDTPLFSWTFMSALEYVVLKKKAKEYDSLISRLKCANDSLANVMHDMNNPLSVIRLAMYHLENPKLPLDKKEAFLKILVNNVQRLDNQMHELRSIRRQMNGNKVQTAKILTIKPPYSSAAST